MAKYGAYEHYKTLDLAAELGICQAYAFGIMCSLWNFTGTYAKDGDISKFDKDSLLRRIGYSGGAEELIKALVKVRLLDATPDSPGYLYVHDWHLHCEDTVHMALARHGLYFANGEAPSLSRFNKYEQERIKAQFYTEDATLCTITRINVHECTSPRTTIAIANAIANANAIGDKSVSKDTLGEFTENCADNEMATAPTNGKVKKPPSHTPKEVEAFWLEFTGIYPKRAGDIKKADGCKIFTRLITTGPKELVYKINDGARDYAHYCSPSIEGTGYVKTMPAFLNQRAWEEDWLAAKELKEAQNASRNSTR